MNSYTERMKKAILEYQKTAKAAQVQEKIIFIFIWHTAGIQIECFDKMYLAAQRVL